MGGGEAFAIEALAKIRLAEQAASERHRRAAGVATDGTPGTWAALAALGMALGGYVLSLARPLRRVSAPATEPALESEGVAHPA